MHKTAFFLAIWILLPGCAQQDPDYHTHTDFKVVLEGQEFDFNKSQYMSTDFKPLSEDVHLHDFDPQIIHFHAKGATLGQFFTSLGMEFTDNCFETSDQNYCTNENSRIYFYVNGKPNQQFGGYIPNDLDKILIYYSSSPPNAEVLDSVTSRACIYSKKCPVPDGVVLPEESCSIGKPCKLET